MQAARRPKRSATRPACDRLMRPHTATLVPGRSPRLACAFHGVARVTRPEPKGRTRLDTTARRPSRAPAATRSPPVTCVASRPLARASPRRRACARRLATNHVDCRARTSTPRVEEKVPRRRSDLRLKASLCVREERPMVYCDTSSSYVNMNTHHASPTARRSRNKLRGTRLARRPIVPAVQTGTLCI